MNFADFIPSSASAIRMLIPGLLVMACTAGAMAQTDAKAGLASKYPLDRGIGKDPHVLFADDFESWQTEGSQPTAGTWDAIRNGQNAKQAQTLVKPGKITLSGARGPGTNLLMLACWHGSPNTAGLRKDLGNYRNQNEGRGVGYEEVFIRYYQRLDSEYRPERNHGSNVGGRDLTQPDCWWCGMANTTDVASHGYFYSGLQPYHDDRLRKLYWGFYSYHMDKPTPWGDDYKPRGSEKREIEVGRWYCLERHLKLNSVDPVKADGVEELWVDGTLAIRRDGLRFRRVPTLRITVFELEVYYHGLPANYTEQKPARVYFDNVVVATERIGCMQPGPMEARNATSTRSGACIDEVKNDAVCDGSVPDAQSREAGLRGR